MRFERVVLASGTTGWYKDNKWHRLDGPAHTSPDGKESWYKDNKPWPYQERKWWER